MRLKVFLDKKVRQFNSPAFINDDPVSIPHLFQKKQDVEIAGFFAAILAWGIRKTIINKCTVLLNLMDNAPYDYIVHHEESDLKRMLGFCHRTFNDTDLLYFIAFLKYHYSKSETLETAFFNDETLGNTNVIESGLNYFYGYFFSLEHAPHRTRKHIAAPFKNSACKRLNMFLRWMVRNDNKGVDFGLWKRVSSASLLMPVDVHVARVAKSLHLLDRTQVDWRAVLELTDRLREFDRMDPVKYDFALFGMGALEKY